MLILNTVQSCLLFSLTCQLSSGAVIGSLALYLKRLTIITAKERKKKNSEQDSRQLSVPGEQRLEKYWRKAWWEEEYQRDGVSFLVMEILSVSANREPQRDTNAGEKTCIIVLSSGTRNSFLMAQTCICFIYRKKKNSLKLKAHQKKTNYPGIHKTTSVTETLLHKHKHM